jgi:hypothetical protein
MGLLPEDWGNGLGGRQPFQDLFYVGLQGNAFDGTLPSSWQELASLQFFGFGSHSAAREYPHRIWRIDGLGESLFGNQLSGRAIALGIGSTGQFETILCIWELLDGKYSSSVSRYDKLAIFLFSWEQLDGQCGSYLLQYQSISCLFQIYEETVLEIPWRSPALAARVAVLRMEKPANNNSPN